MRRRTESALWVGTACLLLLSVTVVRATAPEPLPARGAAAVEDARWLVPAESLGARVLRVVATDPFRISRAPSPVPFGSPPAGSASTVSAVQVPDLQLRGIIGPPWSAIVESATGSSISQLVRAGDSVAGARVIVVRADAVTLHTPDTTWTLKLRRP